MRCLMMSLPNTDTVDHPLPQPPLVGTVNDKGGTVPNYNDTVSDDAVDNTLHSSSSNASLPVGSSWAGCLTCAEDVQFIANATAISAEWARANDPESGVAEVWWAAGLTAGGTSLLAWRQAVDVRAEYLLDDTRNSTFVLAAPLPTPLTTGVRYYVTVRVVNGAGLSTLASSNGVTVDLTPPVLTALWDLDPANSTTPMPTSVQLATDMASAALYATDPESGILEWYYGIGSTPGATDVFDFVAVLANSSTPLPFMHSVRKLELQPGATYYHTARAVNNAGLVSDPIVSSGFTVGLRVTVQVDAQGVLYFDPSPLEGTRPAVSTAATALPGVASTGLLTLNASDASSSVLPASVVSGFTTPLLPTSYARILEVTNGTLAGALKLQAQYMLAASGVGTLPNDADVWFLWLPAASSRRLRQSDSNAARRAVPRTLSDADWVVPEQSCSVVQPGREVDYATRVVSGQVCQPGTIGVFYQHRPTVTMVTPDLNPPWNERSVTVNAQSLDPDGVITSREWAATGPGSQSTVIATDTDAVTYSVEVGVTTFTFTAWDDMGAYSSASVKVTLPASHLNRKYFG